MLKARILALVAFAAIVALAFAGCDSKQSEEENLRLAAIDAANMRSGYAMVSANVITGEDPTITSWYLLEDGEVGSKSDGVCYCTQGNQTELTSIASTKDLTWEKGQCVLFELDEITGEVVVRIVDD